MNVTDGILRCRYRGGFDVPKLMEPDETYRIVVTAPDTANLFKAGHRIRLDVSSSNFPRFDVNPNTGEPLNDNLRRRVATNVVYHGPSRPSRIILPVVPPGRY